MVYIETIWLDRLSKNKKRTPSSIHDWMKAVLELAIQPATFILFFIVPKKLLWWDASLRQKLIPASKSYPLFSSYYVHMYI